LLCICEAELRLSGYSATEMCRKKLNEFEFERKMEAKNMATVTERGAKPSR